MLFYLWDIPFVHAYIDILEYSDLSSIRKSTILCEHEANWSNFVSYYNDEISLYSKEKKLLIKLYII